MQEETWVEIVDWNPIIRRSSWVAIFLVLVIPVGSVIQKCQKYDTIRYDTIGEFNVDWKAEYSALSSTRGQKKKLKQPTPVPL